MEDDWKTPVKIAGCILGVIAVMFVILTISSIAWEHDRMAMCTAHGADPLECTRALNPVKKP